MANHHIYIIGAGFFGATIAERIANDLHLPVVIIDRKPHPGGNSWSFSDPETKIEIHQYGAHIFHTSHENVWNYVNRFSSFNEYKHVVYTKHQDRVYPMPINLQTINLFFQTNFSPMDAELRISRETASERIENPRNFEEAAISKIGRPLYEAFIKNYTRKQWGIEPKELPASIFSRLPLRFNYNNRYFSDSHEGIPTDGYGTLFTRMLNHPLITLRLNVDFDSIRESLSPNDIIVFSGAIDEFFSFSLGKLEWRGVHFETETHRVSDYQGTSVLNYADRDTPFTRIHEFKHFQMPNHKMIAGTVISKEFSNSSFSDESPAYPIQIPRNISLYHQYLQKAKSLENVFFGGRLGGYRYINMDEAIFEALALYGNLKTSCLLCS